MEADNEIPIVLEYNLSHYESIDPCTEADIQARVNLMKEYIENRYRFKREDLLFLLTKEEIVPKYQSRKQKDRLNLDKIITRKVMKTNTEE